MTERPLSRQPECRVCAHEDHAVFRCEMDLGDGVMCPCPPHLPTGIYG